MFFNFFELIRIKDWLKNFILFLPLIFSNNIKNIEKYNELLIAFLIFCLVSSLIYIINDIKDIDSDKLHPIKRKKKPLASNQFSIFFAKTISVIFFLIIFITLYFNKIYIYHISTYIILNIIYTFFAKKIVFIDLLILSFGYVVRVDMGSISIGVQTSTLMILTIFSLSFFVISLKRIGEINIDSFLEKNIYYNKLGLLKFLILVSGFFTLLFYLLYVFLIKNQLFVSIPIVIFLIYRYYKRSINSSDGEFPIDLFFKDKLILFFSVIYFTYAIYVYF